MWLFQLTPPLHQDKNSSNKTNLYIFPTILKKLVIKWIYGFCAILKNKGKKSYVDFFQTPLPLCRQTCTFPWPPLPSLLATWFVYGTLRDSIIFLHILQTLIKIKYWTRYILEMSKYKHYRIKGKKGVCGEKR